MYKYKRNQFRSAPISRDFKSLCKDAKKCNKTSWISCLEMPLFVFSLAEIPEDRWQQCTQCARATNEFHAVATVERKDREPSMQNKTKYIREQNSTRQTRKNDRSRSIKPALSPSGFQKHTVMSADAVTRTTGSSTT